MQSQHSFKIEEQSVLKSSNSFKLLRAPKPLRPSSTSTSRTLLSQMAYDDESNNNSTYGDAVEKNSNFIFSPQHDNFYKYQHKKTE